MYWRVVTFERDRKAETRASTQFAFDLNAPAHGFDDALADDKTQACAAALPVSVVVDLMEWLKQVTLGLYRHSQPRVVNLEFDPGKAWRCRLRAQAQTDTASLGELDRIANQIEKHLLETLGVAHHPLLDIGFDVETQGQTLCLSVRAEQCNNRRRDCLR